MNDMKKRILTLILAVVMVSSMIVFTSCNDKPDLPVGDDSDTQNAVGDDTNGSADDSKSEDTDPPETEPQLEENGLEKKWFSEFIPNVDAQYTGKVGIGANKAGVDFDTFRVISADKKDIYLTEFTDETTANGAIFSGDIADWVVTTDDLDEENKQLTYSKEGSDGAAIFMGNTEWGPYRVNVKVKLADETETAYVYFCVKDENNYYALEVSTTRSAITKTTDGTKETVQEFTIATPANTWIPTSVFLTYDSITAYVNGTELIRVSSVASDEVLRTGAFGVGQWNTQFYIDNFRIIDVATGDVIYVQDFENDDDFVSKCSFGNRNGGGYTSPSADDWAIVTVEGPDGNDTKVLSFQGATSITGAILVFPDIEIPESCEAYRVEMDAYRVGGTGTYEFTAIVWGYESDNDYMCYNYGGWSGMGGLQDITGGSKTNHTISTLIGMETGVWQHMSAEVHNDVVYSYFEGNLIQIYWLD